MLGSLRLLLGQLVSNLGFSEDDVLDENKTYKPETVSALYAFKKEKTFKLNEHERYAKMQEFVIKLSEIYEIEPVVRIIRRNSDHVDSAGSCANPDTKTICMSGPLSIITLLHEFAHIKGIEEELAAQKWAVNLFRKVYPKQFARLVFKDGQFVRTDDT